MFAHISEAALKCDMETTINIQSHCTRITSGNDLLFLFLFFASLFLGNLRHEAQVFIHTRLLRVDTITWKSKKNQQNVGVFSFHFSSSNLFLYQFSICS